MMAGSVMEILVRVHLILTFLDYGRVIAGRASTLGTGTQDSGLLIHICILPHVRPQHAKPSQPLFIHSQRVISCFPSGNLRGSAGIAGGADRVAVQVD